MDDINRNLSRLQLFPDYDTTPMSLEDINEMTTTKALMHCEAVLTELIALCNLNTEEVKKIYAQWNELIKDVNNSKTIMEKLELLIVQADLQESSNEDIDKMFDNSQTPTTPQGLEYATNPDIDNIF